MGTATVKQLCFLESIAATLRQALALDGEQQESAKNSALNNGTSVRGSTVMVSLPGGRWKQLPLDVEIVSRTSARGTLGGKKVDRLTFTIRDMEAGGVVKWRRTQLVPRNQHRFQLVVDGDRESALDFSLQDIKKG